MLTLTNRIDMRPGAVPLVIHLGQYDSDFSLVFELYSSAGNFTVESGTTAMIRGTKTDGNAYDADATIDVSAKTVTVAGSEQMTAAKGRNVYELVLTKSDKVLSTANFILDVERAAMDADTIASESVLKELNAIIAGADTATQAASNAASAADRAEDAAESVSSASAQIATNTADIADLKADLQADMSIVLPSIGEPYVGEILQGTINSDGTDQIYAEPRRNKTGFVKIDKEQMYSIEMNSSIGINVYYYNSSKTNIGQRGDWIYGNQYIVFNENVAINDIAYIRLLFRNSENTNLNLTSADVKLRVYRHDLNAEAKRQTYYSNQYNNNVVGCPNVVLGAETGAVDTNGTLIYSSHVRAITDITRIDKTEETLVSANVNGQAVDALAIYYNSESGQAVTRGDFSNSPFRLDTNYNYFRVYIRKDSSNTAFDEADVIEVNLTRSKTIAEKVSDVQTELRYAKGNNVSVQTKQGAFDGNGIETGGTTRLISNAYIPISYGQSARINAIGNGNNTKYSYIAVFYSVNDYQTAQVTRESRWTETKGVITITDPNIKYFRLYLKNESGNTIEPSDVNVTSEIIDTKITFSSYYPAVSQSAFGYRNTRKYGQDIAVYDGNIFDFETGKVSINGGADIAITNGHGNNCCFGDALHGDYPYLYCAAWNMNEPYIYVNQYNNGSFTLINTITFTGLTGYLNACVDEANNRVYILLNTSDSTYDGVVDFIVGDLSGNIISRRNIDNIPVIEGMTFYEGSVIVSSGHGIGYPSYIHIFDTEGNLLSKTAPMHTEWDKPEWIDTIEGIDIDKATGKMYIGLTKYVFTN